MIQTANVSKPGTEGTTEPTLPEGWEITTLGQVTHIEMGQSPPSQTYNTSGDGLPFFQGKAEFGTLYPEVRKYCSSPKKVAKEGAILMSVRAPVGPTNLAPDTCCIGRGLAAIQPRSGVDTSFLLYFFRAIEPILSTEGTGSTFAAISGGYLRGMSIKMPPYAEQRRIVAKIEELFSELDDSVANLKAARARLQTYRQSLLKHAFEGRLTEQWRRDHAQELESADQLLERIRGERQARYQQQLQDWKAKVAQWEADGEPGKKPKRPRTPKEPEALHKDVFVGLPGLPDSWDWDRLGWMTLGIEYGTSQKSEASGDVPVVRMGNLQQGAIVWDDLVYCSDSTEIERYELSEDDVLFNRTNSPELVGKTAIYRGERRALFAGYLIRINHMKDEIDSDYLNYFLMSHIARRYGDHVKTDAVNQSNINGDKLFHYPFPYCSLREQKEIANQLHSRLSDVEYLEKSIAISLVQSDSLRQSILKRAFEGRLVSQNSMDEPASELLSLE